MERIREYAEQYPGVKYVEGAKPWGEKADIALPSATQNELNGDHARQLVANGCMAVSEGANMPSTPEAIKVFQDAFFRLWHRLLWYLRLFPNNHTIMRYPKSAPSLFPMDTYSQEALP